MGRAPCCDKGSRRKGPWSPEEDRKLREYIHSHGTGGNWIALPTKAGLRRCGKSCRLRWLNYLRPNIRHGGFSDEEDRLICGLFATIGSRWSVIAAQLPGRTDNDVKNHWNTKLKKKLHRLLMDAAAAGLPVPAPCASPCPPAAVHPCSSFFLRQHQNQASSSASSGLLMSSSSLCSVVDNGGLCCFDISDNNELIIRNNGTTAVGLESFMFGGLHLQQQDTTQGDHHLFPAAAAEPENHQRHYFGSYEHHMKPMMISPSCRSFFFYGDGEEVAAAGVTLQGTTRFMHNM